MPTKEKETLSRAEEIELRWKELQIEDMEERMVNRREAKDRAAADRQRQYEDFKKNQAIMTRRQNLCKHRKGGRDNKFWNGNSQDYSINRNIFPTGEEAIFCTRCGKEVRKPTRELRKTDPKLYAEMMVVWRKWSDLPTDNTPSGSKIFEIIPDDAVADAA
jgi:hypothetical protein